MTMTLLESKELTDVGLLAQEEIEVTVVMPCLDEARTVGTCVAKVLRTLQEMNVRGEVVVADNGRMDGSPEIARRCGARVVHAERKGYGAALQGGDRRGAGLLRDHGRRGRLLRHHPPGVPSGD